MWILPKQLHTSAFVQDTKELGLDSEAFSRISEKSLMWRGKDSLSRTWLRRWNRVPWIKLLSSRTLKPSHTKSFEDALISSLAGSRVSPSQLRDSVKQLKIPDTCSHISGTESRTANLELSFSRTWQESSLLKLETEIPFSNMSSENWKAWVIEQRQEYSQRKKLAHHIREKGSSSWATPQVADAQRAEMVRTPEQLAKARSTSEMAKQGKKRGGCRNLREDVMQPQNWPTPATRDYKGANSIQHITGETASQRGHMGQLPNAVLKSGLQDQQSHSTSGKHLELFPTPRANKVHPEITEENRARLADRNKSNLEEEIAGHCGKATGKLNPDWVEQLMGLPTGWTDLGSWVTE